jgi:hypothetical protein
MDDRPWPHGDAPGPDGRHGTDVIRLITERPTAQGHQDARPKWPPGAAFRLALTCGGPNLPSQPVCGLFVVSSDLGQTFLQLRGRFGRPLKTRPVWVRLPPGAQPLTKIYRD